MHDVERAARHVGDHDGAVRGFSLHFRRARIAVALGAGDTAREKIGLHARHHVAVLGMDQRQCAQLRAAAEGIVEFVVIYHQGALVSHEVLEGVDAIGLHDGFHLVVDLRRPLRHRHVEGIISTGLLGLVAPRLVGGEHRFARCGNAEVDDHRRAAGKPCLGAPLEIIGGDLAHEHQFHVGVRVDAARHDVAATRIDNPGTRRRIELRSDGDDLAAVDQHIGALRMVMVDDGSAANKRAHGCCLLPVTQRKRASPREGEGPSLLTCPWPCR